jgi:hypothetical protein
MWYIAIIIMLLVSLFVGFKLTLAVDKHLSEPDSDDEHIDVIASTDKP